MAGLAAEPAEERRRHGALPTRVARARQIAGHPRIRVDAPELLLGTRYTLDTVRALRRVYPRARFVWLMGADILPQLVDWAGWRDLFGCDPHRRLRPARLGICGAGGDRAPHVRPLPGRRRECPPARLLRAAGLVLYPEPSR